MSNIVDIYGLTPAQEGIYFQYALNPAGKAYHLQFLLRIKSSVDPEILEKAIDLLPLRHDVLRSAFAISSSTGKVKQVVLKNRGVSFKKIVFDTDEDKKKLEEIVGHDAEIQFDLQKDPLFRTVLVAFNDARYLIISTHHIVVDGWSLSILANDIERFYDALSSGRTVEELKTEISHEKNASIPFSAYVEWIKRTNNEETKTYWRNMFRGYAGNGGCSSETHAGDSWFDPKILSLGRELTEKLEAFAAERNITMNTLFEAALALAMHNESGSEDVVFAKVVSGRNAKLNNIFESVGLFVNTIPVRVTFKERMDANELLRNIQEQSAMADRYGSLSLSEICRITALGRGSVKVLLAFENYPFEYSGGSVGFELVENKDQTDFDIALTVTKENGCYSIKVLCAPYCGDKMRSLPDELRSELMNIMENDRQDFVKRTEKSPAEDKYSKKIGTSSPESDTELMVCEKFSEILHIPSVGMDTDFFLSGGSSIDVLAFLSDERFRSISASEFITDPTPAGICAVLKSKKLSRYEYLQPLFVPEKCKRTLILVPYAGGNAESYSELTQELRRELPDTALYFIRFLHSIEECRAVFEEVKSLGNFGDLYFYAHCIGDSVALQLVDFIEENGGRAGGVVVGANIPSKKPFKHNWWNIVPDLILKKILIKAGSKIGDLSGGQSRTLLRLFRKDCDFFIKFFRSRTRKITSPLSVIINRNDIFTKDHKNAAENWQKYAENEVLVRYIESDTHYFQSKNADILAKMIAESCHFIKYI